MSQSQVDDPHVLRIMVSTDNHLGVWERDEWRAEDSFVSFREVFNHAKHQRSDLVLLGGDLFHDNKPSRQTLFKCLQILNEHCLGPEPISFQVASSASLMESGVTNTQDPNLNIGLPVFTIHGNHDDPSGPENLSAVDLLSAVHYVNYFGKHTMTREGTDDVGKIVLSPVLLMKGDTKVALYGLGFMREERLARAFQVPGQVEWLRPTEGPEDWFNVFVLHQNRVQHYRTDPGRRARSVRAEFLPDWLDIVVWGHEHESRPAADDAPLQEQGFVIAQPGSSVATSLSEQEAKPKHCFALEVCRDAFRLTPLSLTTARPFKFKTVSLQELGAEPGNHSQIEQLLADVVEGMVAEAEHEQRSAPADAATHPLGPSADGDDRPQRLPLIRLRVDYTGFTTIHTLRFGQRFVNRVANPNDILLWHKSTERKAREVKQQAPMHALPADLDEVQIEDLIAEFTGHLAIAPVVEIGEALKRFVEKDEKSALSDAYNKILKDTQEAALDDLGKAAAGGDAEGAAAEATADDDEAAERQVIDAVHAAGQRLQAEAIAKFSEADVRLRLAEEDAGRADAGGEGDENMAVSDGSEEEEPAAAPPRAAGRRGAAAKKPAASGTAAGSRAGTSKAPPAAPSRAARGGGRARKQGAAEAPQKATLEHLFSQSQARAASKGRKTQAGGGTQVRSRLAAAGLGPTQVDEDMDDPIEDSPQGSDDYIPPATTIGAPRGRIRGRAAAEEASISDEGEGRAKKRVGAGSGASARAARRQ